MMRIKKHKTLLLDATTAVFVVILIVFTWAALDIASDVLHEVFFG